MLRPHPTTLLALLAAISPVSVSAFSDTSPYIISHPSAESPLDDFRSATSTTTLLPHLRTLTAACTADTYLLITLPHTHESDLHHYPLFHAALVSLSSSSGSESSPESNGFLQLPFVVPSPDITATDIVNIIAETASHVCGARVEEPVVIAAGGTATRYDGVTPRVVRVEFDSASAGGGVQNGVRDTAVVDRVLKSLVEGAPTRRVMVVVATTPVFSAGDAENVVDSEEREAGNPNGEKGDNGDETKGGLFEKYQFFTPAVLMGYVVLLVVAAIGYVGVSALEGLKVSYGAFEKEMGPGGQKKGQ
ncbi:hypothetical protein EX30DRAFT_229704 [Ascodesmis nigricans]|uniref:Protein BIG1 n=1 Tax=Ascodesmis nigricans TaxID=341454 RepID=A0A4S2MIZ6_9PEZI|nr:hypothetical protein EX30DRAFT_229704 [Ascodesmis nigricans]